MFFISFCLVLGVLPCLAEKVSFKITPLQLISTENDEVEVGDTIDFISVKDVYMNGNLFIARNTHVSGIVDFVHQNGWAGDRAEIWIKKFYVKTKDDKKIEINYPIKIIKTPQDCKHLKDYFVYYVLGSIRGSEIYIEPDTKVYNIFIER